jgi:hypothetical protein
VDPLEPARRSSIRAWRLAVYRAFKHALKVRLLTRRNSLKLCMIPDLGCCVPSCAQTPTHSREVEPQHLGAQQLYRSEAGVPDCTGLRRAPHSWLAPLPAQPLSLNRLKELGSSWGEGDAQALLGCYNSEGAHTSHLSRRSGWQGAKRHRTGLCNVDALPKRKVNHIQAHDQALHKLRLQGQQKDSRILCMVKADTLLTAVSRYPGPGATGVRPTRCAIKPLACPAASSYHRHCNTPTAQWE